MENYTDIHELILKHLTKKITEDESARLNTWVEENEINRQFFDGFNNEPELRREARLYSELKKEDVEQAWIRVREQLNKRGKVVQFKRWAYAAAVLLIVFTSIYLLQQMNRAPNAPVIVKSVKQDAKPNTKQAYLTLDNGETIILDSLQNGLLATQGNTKVLKYSDGVLRYSHEKKNNQQLIYNKVTVPKGSDVVHMQLSESTKVWLNAESSIRYPVVFAEDERRVDVTGEVYFEVAASKSQGDGSRRSFIVNKGSMNIVVLGTKFNVNTYENEPNMKVTLLEGVIKVQQAVNKKRVERIINPGQQAILNDSEIKIKNNVDVEQVMAWRNGKFFFEDTDLEVIMRQIERWYDVKVSYKGNVLQQQITLTGEISRYSNASQVLALLETTRILRFNIDGKKITVRSAGL